MPNKGIHKCHHPNVDSVVISYDPAIPSSMKRAFIATDHSGIRTVAPHSHRTDITITVLRGSIIHHTFSFLADSKVPRVEGNLHNYRSVILGGEGISPVLDTKRLAVESIKMNVGDKVFLPYNKIHTVEWDADAVWMVEEGDIKSDETTVFIRSNDSFDVDALYQDMSGKKYYENVCSVILMLLKIGRNDVISDLEMQ